MNDILEKFRIKGQITRKWLGGGIVVQIDNWNNIIDIANVIYESGMVKWCHPDFATIIERATTDPMFNQQYYLKNTGQNSGTQGIDINVEPAWAITKGSIDIRVAVIDDGVENHEDFDGRVLQGFTAGNASGFGAPIAQIPSGVTIGHGVACAGILAASHNTKGIAGIAPNVKIVPINIFHEWSYDPWYGKFIVVQPCQNIVDAFEFAWDPYLGNADVISNSWHYPPTNSFVIDAITNAITNALTLGRLRNGKRLGCVVVAASGNSGNTSGVAFPAAVNGVLTVGAIDKNGIIWGYSDRGKELDVVVVSGNTLPGDIVTTDREGSKGYVSGNYFSNFGGTSAACPQVAGIAALLLSKYPYLRQTDVKYAIESTCKKLTGYPETSPSRPGWNKDVGYGLVNAYAAISSIVPKISGPDIVCTNGVFSMNYGLEATWSVSSGFSRSPSTGTSTTVTPTSYSGQSGTVMAVVNGVTLTKTIKVLSIVGSSGVCTSGTFSINSGESATWSVTSGFSRTPTTGASTTVTATTSGITGTLTAVVNGITLTMAINSCPALLGPDKVCKGGNAAFVLSADQAIGWSIIPTSVFTIIHSTATTAIVTSNSSNGESGTIFALRSGTSPITKSFTASCSKSGGNETDLDAYVTVYPNPTDVLLNIEIDAAGYVLDQKSKSIVTVPSFDVRLYDGQGNLQRQATTKGGNVQFDLANLPNGVYYLIVNDGVSNPVMRQVVVEH